MQATIKGKVYGFIWGTKCLIDTQKQLGVDINTYLGSIANPEVLTVLIYHGLKLWCNKHNEVMPFSSYDDFIEEYDTLFDEEFYQHIVTDLLESMYLGQELHEYISKFYNVELTGMKEVKEAKKKYLSTLAKSKSTSPAGGTKRKK